MPKFSIIVPVYNVAPYLRECLDSVLHQTFIDWECLCVNDGSKDESGAILDEYARKDKRFRIFHKPNGGVSSARNLALDNVRGEWIGFLDGDDIWVPQWLETIAQEINQANVDWVHVSRTYEWAENTPSLSVIEPVTQRQSFTKENLLAHAWEIISRCGYPISNFYRSSKIKGHYFIKDIRFREDALFLYEVSMVLSTGTRIDCCGYNRRLRQGSATFSYRHRDDTRKLLSEYLKIWKRLDLTKKNKHPICHASTYWIEKDVRGWFEGCPNRTLIDTFQVWVLVWRLSFKGAFKAYLVGTIFDKLRWLIFLGTGWGKILFFTRLSFKRNKNG